MKACSGVGASLSPEEVAKWEREHLALLEEIAPQEFEVLHYAEMVELKKKTVILNLKSNLVKKQSVVHSPLRQALCKGGAILHQM